MLWRSPALAAANVRYSIISDDETVTVHLTVHYVCTDKPHGFMRYAPLSQKGPVQHRDDRSTSWQLLDPLSHLAKTRDDLLPGARTQLAEYFCACAKPPWFSEQLLEWAKS